MKKLASMRKRRLKTNPNLMFVTNTDLASYHGVIFPQIIMYKGLIRTQSTIRWMQMLATEEIVGNYIESTNLKKLIENGFCDLSAIGSTILAKSCIDIPLNCIVRGFYVPKSHAWDQYKLDSTICGNTLPEGLVPYQQLSEPIFTPYFPKEGRYFTFDETVSLLGKFIQNVFVLREGTNPNDVAIALAQKVKEKAISVYKFAYNYAIQNDIIIADANITFGILMKNTIPELVLTGNIFTPDTCRIWDARLYEVGIEQFSMGNRELSNYFYTHKLSNKLVIPERILQDVSSSYIDVFQRLFDANVINLSENILWSWKNAIESFEEEQDCLRTEEEVQAHFAQDAPDN